MARIAGRFCIDRWEAQIELLDETGRPDGINPSNRGMRRKQGRAVSRPGVYPQGHVSQKEAAAACQRAGKRLCTNEEWLAACRGRRPTRFPYGPRFRKGICHGKGISPLRLLHGESYQHDYATLNDPRLNRVPGGLARTGSFHRCTNDYGVFDMVGNVHEWTADPHGVFRGGYYLDTKSLGVGCEYATTEHSVNYRDYSTGFRCCK